MQDSEPEPDDDGSLPSVSLFSQSLSALAVLETSHLPYPARPPTKPANCNGQRARQSLGEPKEHAGGVKSRHGADPKSMR